MTKLVYHVQGFTPAAVAAGTAQRNAKMIKTMDLQPWAVDALKRGDLAGFVRIHNGHGQVAQVTVLLERVARRHGWSPELARA